MVDLCIALDILNTNYDSIVSELQTCETYNTAIDEIERSVLFIQTIDDQNSFIHNCRVTCSCVFLPLNQPLYSFFLQVVSLAMVSDQVVFRPPEVLRDIYCIIYKRFECCFNNIELFCGTRNDFLNKYVKKSEIVNFIGKYENALSIVSDLAPNQLMIFNGSAINPIVIDSDAKIPVAANAVIKASFYNSGQDCMAPAMVFLQRSIKDEFFRSIKSLVDKICLGDYSNKEVSIGPLISKDAYKEAIAYINNNRKKILYGGNYIKERMFISPTVFLNEDCLSITERFFYAPFIIIYVYQDIWEVIDYLKTPFAQTFKGYISYYGRNNKGIFDENKELPFLLYNATLLDYECPNMEFGGYGEGCSFLCFDRKIIAKPILLLRDIYEWKNKKSKPEHYAQY